MYPRKGGHIQLQGLQVGQLAGGVFMIEPHPRDLFVSFGCHAMNNVEEERSKP
jgi:hypothetical protein